MPQTSAHHYAMMASRRGHVKDTGHDSDGEEFTMSDVESDDEISPRDERANRRARDLSSAEPTTETLEVRVKGQDGVNKRHRDSTSCLQERYLDVGLGTTGFWEGDPDDRITIGLH